MKELIRHILKEETNEVDQNVMNFLLRRYKVEEHEIGDFILKTMTFNVNGEYYGVGAFDNKRAQIMKIVNMLEEYNVIEPINNFSNENDPYRQKIIRTIKKFLVQVM